MPMSYPKQFWTWFQRNSDTLLSADKMKKNEQDYWMREIAAHLHAYTKRLSYAILWDKDAIARFVITADGNSEYFNMAEKFVAKAPAIKDWEIFGLRPPNLLPFKYIEHHAHKVGIDLSKCWCTPPVTEDNGEISIKVYAEIYTTITDDMEHMASTIVYNILGEKVFTNDFDHVKFDSLFNRTVEEKKEELIELARLPQYIVPRERPGYFIGADGSLKEKLPDRYSW